MIQKLLHLATLLRCVHAPEHVCGGVKVLAHEQVWLSLHGELEVPGTVLHVTGRGRCGRKNLSWYAKIGVLVEWNCVRREQWWLRKYKRIRVHGQINDTSEAVRMQSPDVLLKQIYKK